ncbi:MAG: YbaB/EbfC family nucleoid-associated protein [Planctomycetota bacterium]
MFDQMKQLKQLAGMLGNAGELKAKFEAVQADLEQKVVEADAGAGAVRVTVNGKLQVVGVTLDPAMVAALVGTGDDADRGMVEELIASATNAALTQAQEMVRDEMMSITGGLDMQGLPGLDKLMGG